MTELENDLKQELAMLKLVLADAVAGRDLLSHRLTYEHDFNARLVDYAQLLQNEVLFWRQRDGNMPSPPSWVKP